jgi:hypothetical protein
MKNIYVTLRFQAFTNQDRSRESVENIGRHVKHIVREWNDGRRPFQVEAMQAAVREILNTAMKKHFFDLMKNVFGDDRVELAPNFSVLRASVEADKFAKDMSINTDYLPAVLDVSADIDSSEPASVRWKVLSRDDRKPGRLPGVYSPSSKVFQTYEEGLAYASAISASRGPIVVCESQVTFVLAALNSREE